MLTRITAAMLNNRSRSKTKTNRSPEAGFSLLEMVIAMVILTFGLLGVAGAISYALMAGNRGRGVTNSNMLIVSALEQIETLRNTGQLTFNEISNSHVNGSVFTFFPTEFLPVSVIPGNDGVFGTADDLIVPGPDGIYGNSDDRTDTTLARPGVTRQILITSINPSLKKIKVTLRYSPNGGETKELVGISYLNDDTRSNYVP
ncbi:MAG: type IV pilus modification PilV family protein [Pyrinomonadaceae bacterium]